MNEVCRADTLRLDADDWIMKGSKSHTKNSCKVSHTIYHFRDNEPFDVLLTNYYVAYNEP